MCLQIGGTYPNSEYPDYRGSDRMPPWEPDDSVRSALFDHYIWYVRNSVPCIPSNDLGKARLLVDSYFAHFPEREMEVIELSKPREVASYSDELLGYDLTSGHSSFLPWAIDPARHDHHPPEDYAGPHFAPLLRAVSAHFFPLLNRHLLFNSDVDAELCLRCLQALNQLYGEPWLFEHPDTEFAVMGVWLVYRPVHYNH